MSLFVGTYIEVLNIFFLLFFDFRLKTHQNSYSSSAKTDNLLFFHSQNLSLNNEYINILENFLFFYFCYTKIFLFLLFSIVNVKKSIFTSKSNAKYYDKRLNDDGDDDCMIFCIYFLP